MFNKALPNKLLQEQTFERETTKVTEMPTLTLTVKQLMRELNISDKTARNLVHSPGFPSFRLGNRVLINRKALEAWIDRQTEQNAA